MHTGDRRGGLNTGDASISLGQWAGLVFLGQFVYLNIKYIVKKASNCILVLIWRKTSRIIEGIQGYATCERLQ